MADPAAGPAEFALASHSVLEIEGPDAVAFAQAQCMNDVAALADRSWQWNGWLTPKGRLVALFALLRLDARRLWLVCPDVPAAELGAPLRRFVFRSKVTLRERDDLVASGRFGAPATADGAEAGIDGDGAVELDMGAGGVARTLHIASSDGVGDAAADDAWRAFDLAHGLPRLPATQSGQFTPQMLSLQRLRAFSVKKGCYPGQEIVARTHFLGQAKRGLALLESDAALEAGAEVMSEGRSIGSLACVARDGDHWIALAVVPVEHPATLEINGRPVHERPLRDGLAR
ncbi:CAF17-like 4Fe-4S cluster assembly/insertion protein YgfZ [Luteimonas pelagia]